MKAFSFNRDSDVAAWPCFKNVGSATRECPFQFIGGAWQVQTVKTLGMLRNAVAGLRDGGARIALVPTMGALHEGHLALVRRARAEADHVVASIFVNPRQFGANEDLDAYPRQLAEDAAMLEAEGCALLWAPPVEAMYPAGFATNVSVAGVSEGLCGAARPGHFDGVATVVLKLFNQVQPDLALFGEKDFQQLAVIRTMARDLDLTHPHADAIIGVPTVREGDGLAMSSRNRYLSPEQRADAVALPRAMRAAIASIEGGGAVDEALGTLQSELLAGGFSGVDYAVLADAASLRPLAALEGRPARLLVAARIGGTRLIDNMAVGA
jgi:pantoate--beta-alanine ligase